MQKSKILTLKGGFHDEQGKSNDFWFNFTDEEFDNIKKLYYNSNLYIYFRKFLNRIQNY